MCEAAELPLSGASEGVDFESDTDVGLVDEVEMSLLAELSNLAPSGVSIVLSFERSNPNSLFEAPPSPDAGNACSGGVPGLSSCDNDPAVPMSTSCEGGLLELGFLHPVPCGGAAEWGAPGMLGCCAGGSRGDLGECEGEATFGCVAAPVAGCAIGCGGWKEVG